VQEQENGKRMFFKEYGDPRSISPQTGKVDNSLPIEEQATAIYFEALYFPGNPCGVPRWAGVIPALLGGREAEMVNLEFFRDNAIPAMAVLVSGGALTEESFYKIEQYIDGVRGRTSMNRIVVLEATSEGADAAAIDGSLPAPKVDIKPMLSERQNEGLFKDYIQDGERKARQSFRLPPVYVGSASEYNRASAFASMLTADQQIFVPERFAWDQMFDRVVLSSHRFKFWRVRSAGPGITDPQEVARIVNSLGREGALTPNIAIKLANRYLDADIPAIAEDWGNVPYSSTLQLIKNDMVIEGINEFVDAVDAAVSPVDPNTEAQQTEQGLDNVQKVLRRLLDDVSEKLASDLDDAVQSIAAE
jgi:capsid portal protein